MIRAIWHATDFDIVRQGDAWQRAEFRLKTQGFATYWNDFWEPSGDLGVASLEIGQSMVAIAASGTEKGIKNADSDT